MYLQQPRNIRKKLAMNRKSYSAERTKEDQLNAIYPPSSSQNIQSSSSRIEIDNKDQDYNLDQSNNHNNNQNEEDNFKIKEEAKLLIAKTKRMMDELNNNKEKKLKDYSISKDRLSTLCSSTPSLNHFSQKLLDKAKRIKLLERELKDKNTQLRIAQEKLQMKNEEISKLNEALTIERSNTLKAENAKLQRKIVSIEKANEENKKTYEKLIEEYKTKLNQYTILNKDQESKIKEIEQHNKKIAFEVNKLQSNVHQKDNSVKELIEKIDIEKKVCERKATEIAMIKNQMSTLIAIMKSLYEKETKKQQTTSLFLNKLRTLVNDEDNELMKSGMSSKSDYGYDRAGMNNIDYQTRVINQRDNDIQKDIAIDYSFN